MPPEARGALISLVDGALQQTEKAALSDLRRLGAFIVAELVSTTQALAHLEQTLDRVTVNMGDSPGGSAGVRIINEILAGPRYAGCVERCTAQLTNSVSLLGRPFLRNDEPDFMLAQFPLHHPGYDGLA